jgi:Tail tubular protein
VYSELEAVNACLASMGEAPILSLDVPHPYVPAAVSYLAKHNKLVQTNRWWFNTTAVTLTPVSGDVTASLPAGAIGIIGKQGAAYVLNADGTVYDIARGEEVTTPIDVFVVREVAFTSLPPEANAYISDCAILDFQVSFDGDGGRTQMLRENRLRSWTMLHAQNIRLTKTNLFRRAASKLNDMRGDRPFLRGQE